MKILQICKKFPFPTRDGESLAIVQMAASLVAARHEVFLLSMNTLKHLATDAHLHMAHSIYRAGVQSIEIDNRVRPLPALANLFFSEKSYHIARFDCPVFRKALSQLLQSHHFDLIQLETLYPAVYLDTIRQHTNAPVVMRAHNIEHEIWERVAATAPSLQKWYLQKITPRLRKFEVEQLNRYDWMLTISPRDQAQLQELGMKIPSTVVPVGLDCASYLPDYQSFDKPLRLGFIGSLDWLPNLDGLRWFFESVWKPLILPRFPQLQLHIAGRNTPDWLKKYRMKNVVVHGEVADAQAFIAQHSVMIAPLFSGSGMRVKIVESMALGKVCLTTTIGLEGIQARHRQEVLIADTPKAFAEEIAFALAQPAKLKWMGQAARRLCEEHYDNLLISKHLEKVYEKLLTVHTPL